MSNSHDHIFKLKKVAVWAIIRDRGLGRNSLAEVLGRDATEVGKWINGKRGVNFKNAQALADALRCTIKQMTGEEVYVPKRKQLGDPDPGSDGAEKTTAGTTTRASIEINDAVTQEQILGLIKELNGRVEGLAEMLRKLLGNKNEN